MTTAGVRGKKVRIKLHSCLEDVVFRSRGIVMPVPCTGYKSVCTKPNIDVNVQQGICTRELSNLEMPCEARPVR